MIGGGGAGGVITPPPSTNARATAAFASTYPAPHALVVQLQGVLLLALLPPPGVQVAKPDTETNGRAVVLRMSITCDDVRLELADSINETMPVTTGVEKLVPAPPA